MLALLGGGLRNRLHRRRRLLGDVTDARRARPYQVREGGPYGVLYGLLGFVHPQLELLVVRSDVQAPVEEHQAVLEVPEVVQRLGLLVYGLHEVSVDVQGGLGVFKGVVRLA